MCMEGTVWGDAIDYQLKYVTVCARLRVGGAGIGATTGPVF